MATAPKCSTTLTAAGDIGKGIAVGLIIGLWVAADFIMLACYGVFRLIRR
jgi:hypothetical protein